MRELKINPVPIFLKYVLLRMGAPREKVLGKKGLAKIVRV